MVSLLDIKYTIPEADRKNIRSFLKGRILPRGLGDENNACSIASINLALSGVLTDDIPKCMSPFIGNWIIGIQDIMPDSVRNSNEWRQLLPWAAGTGQLKKVEAKRHIVLKNWVFTQVFPLMTSLVEKDGTAKEVAAWKRVLKDKKLVTKTGLPTPDSNVLLTSENVYVSDYFENVFYNEVDDSSLLDGIVSHLKRNGRNEKEIWKDINPARVLREMILVGVKK